MSYPDPIKTMRLKVSDLHTIDIRAYGNPDGKPVIFLHGGPGGGCPPSCTEFFDLNKWFVILFDQRGCGASTPFAELRENTTWDLVADIEKIREAFGYQEWVVFGGSWGSTLSLAYAQTHPERCQALVLRGIFLCTPFELDWLYEGSLYFPDAYDEFMQPIKNVEGRDVVDKYYKLLTSDDEKTRLEAAKVWSLFELRLAHLETNWQELEAELKPEFALPFARIECHYFQNKAFFNEENAILNNLDKIQDISTFIAHGRYDALCVPKIAWDLHKALPKSEIAFCPKAGHAAGEASIKQKLQEFMETVWKQLS